MFVMLLCVIFGCKMLPTKTTLDNTGMLYVHKEFKHEVQKDYEQIYIFGTESSGTRFLSRSVASLFDNRLRWNGEMPACKRVADKKVVHVSLPWGDWCDGRIQIEQDFDICNKHIHGRKFANITNTLKSNDKRIAIIINRNKDYVIKSIRKHHCKSENFTNMEYETAQSIIKRATEEISSRILQVEYERLDTDEEWFKILKFLNLSKRKFKKPKFVNGNKI